MRLPRPGAAIACAERRVHFAAAWLGKWVDSGLRAGVSLLGYALRFGARAVGRGLELAAAALRPDPAKDSLGRAEDWPVRVAIGAVSVALSGVLVAASFGIEAGALGPWLGVFAAFLALAHFGYIVTKLFVPRRARIGVHRSLLLDSALSTVVTVLAFAVLYLDLGIGQGACPETAPRADRTAARDHIYFSMVTFSTLGYGDFRPCTGARLAAAAQAILGNPHLALIAGAVLAALPPGSDRVGENSGQDDDDEGARGPDQTAAKHVSDLD